MTVFDENYHKIFGDKKPERGSWVYDRELGRLVPKDEYVGPISGDEFPAIMKPLEAFLSPVDGSVISDRSKLREHNKRNGVTNVQDYGETYFDRRGKERYADMTGSTKAAKKDRVETIKEAMYRHGIH